MKAHVIGTFRSNQNFLKINQVGGTKDTFATACITHYHNLNDDVTHALFKKSGVLCCTSEGDHA